VDFSGVLEDANAFAVIKSSYTKHAALQQAGPYQRAEKRGLRGDLGVIP
jgi:hypothetical protein